MKKFLSLVLAMIMILSLVTISAGATEYADLTDLDEITYDEAVAVLNKIGIIQGYPDGSYKPQAPLTRQVAAKFVVSLLIGPEAADNLTAAVAPYPDVPVSSQFAGYISYCKTANIISGYSDGTFKPEAGLTGYAFAKMLLGAIGYRSDIEGFTGTGYTMNVAKIGNAANLFDRLQFQGGEILNREEAAQLCLNTLKATMVEYSGGFSVTAGDAVVTGAQARSYVTSNQSYAANIDNRKVTQIGNNTSSVSHYTVEFGEEHFKDLRLNDEHVDEMDIFGRPSNVWSWKKVTIGVFPIAPDFEYTTQVAAADDVKSTPATKVRALGLNGYNVDDPDRPYDTQVFVNGKQVAIDSVADIADFTDNGTVVQVYVDEDIADWISHVVVVQTQLMQIKKIAGESVSLKKYKDEGANSQLLGFNNKNVGATNYKAPYTRLDTVVEDVEVNDDCYDFLSGLKADDIVAIVPVTEDDGVSYTVAAAYQPEKVTGALTGSYTFSQGNIEDKQRSVTEVTVGGTAYKVATWNKNLQDINRNVLAVTKKDVTLYLDEFGNAMLALDVGSTSDYMILGSWKSAIVNGSIVRIASGWDISGNPVELNVGNEKGTVVSGYDINDYDSRFAGTGIRGFQPGDVLRYTNDGATGDAEWVISKVGVFKVPGNASSETGVDTLAIKSSNSTIELANFRESNPDRITDNRPLVANSVKTIYVNFDEDGVEYVEVKNGLQNVAEREIQAGAYWKQAEATINGLSSNLPTATSEVTAVVIKTESSDASLKNLGYVYDLHTTNTKDANGDIITDYRVLTQDDDVTMKSTNGVGNRRFVRYTELEDGMYRLKNYDRIGVGTSTLSAVIDRTAVQSQRGDYFFHLNPDQYKVVSTGVTLGNSRSIDTTQMPNINKNTTDGVIDGNDLTTGDRYADLISVKGAKFLDLRIRPAKQVSSAKDLKELVNSGTYGTNVNIDIAFNDNPSSDDFRLAYYVIITGVTERTSSAWGTTTTTQTPTDTDVYSKLDPEIYGTVSGSIEVLSSGVATIEELTLTKPDWAYAYLADGNGGAVEIEYDVLVGTSKDNLSVYRHITSTLAPASVLKSAISSASGNKATLLTPDSGTPSKITKFTMAGYNLNNGGGGTNSIISLNDAKGKVIRIEVTKIDWKYANVEHYGVFNDVEEKLTLGINVATPDSYGLKTASAGSTLTLAYSKDKYDWPAGGTVEWKVDNASAPSGTNNATQGRMTGPDADTATTSANLVAEVGKTVKVTITGLERKAATASATVKYSDGEDSFGGNTLFQAVKLSDLDASTFPNNNDTIQVVLYDVSGTSDITPVGGKIDSKLALFKDYQVYVKYANVSTETNIAGYEITVSVTGGADSQTITPYKLKTANGTDNNDSANKAATFTATGDVELTVSVKPIEKVRVKDVKFSLEDKTVTVEFTGALNTGSVNTNSVNWSEGTWNSNSVGLTADALKPTKYVLSNNDTTLTLYMNSSFVAAAIDGSTSKFSFTGLTSDTFAIADQIVTLKADGTFAVADR